MSDTTAAALPEDLGEQPTDQTEVRIWTTQGESPEEQPTTGAFVRFKVEKLGAVAEMHVPDAKAGQLIDISPLLLGMLCSTAAPIALLQSTTDLNMPWAATLALAIVLAIIPIVYVLLRNRRAEV